MRILFLTHRLPYAPNRGDRIRAYHTLQLLRRTAEVHLVSLVHDSEEAAQASTLAGLAASVSVAPVHRARALVTGALRLPSSTPLTHSLLDSPVLEERIAAVVSQHPPDVVLAFCSGMARPALLPPLAGRPLVIEMVDVDSAKWRDLVPSTRFPMRSIYAREARCLSRFEAEAVRAAYATTVVNEKERSALLALAPGGRVEAVPSGVDLDGLRPPDGPASSSDVVFCGVMNYQPNEDAAVWLATEVWPLVRERMPEARLRLVGANPSRAVRDLAGPGVDVTGSVPDVRPYLWGAAVAVAPLRVARGIQNKVLEAVAAGLPTVVTSVVAAGLPEQVMPACTVADTPRSMADAIVSVLQLSPADRRARAESADLAPLSWGARLRPLQDLLFAAAGRRPPA